MISFKRSEWKGYRNNVIKIEDIFNDLWIRTPGVDFRAIGFLRHGEPRGGDYYGEQGPGDPDIVSTPSCPLERACGLSFCFKNQSSLEFINNLLNGSS